MPSASSNIDFEAWGDYLGDPPLAMAFIDRLVDGATADWATRIAVAQAAERTIPYLIVAGAAFSGAYGVHVGRAGANGQLAGLTAGTLLEQSERRDGRARGAAGHGSSSVTLEHHDRAVIGGPGAGLEACRIG